MWSPTALRRVAFAITALLLIGIAARNLYALGVRHGQALPPAAEPADTSISSIAAGEAATRRHIDQGLKAGQTDPANGRTILYYQDPMVPGKRFDAPAKSPFMDMMLVPVYGGGAAAGDSATVSVSPRIQQSLGVRTAEVGSGRLRVETSAVGRIVGQRGRGTSAGTTWAVAELPESQAARVSVGAGAELRAIAGPGRVFRGTVRALRPEVDTVTLTRQARIELAEHDTPLRAGMFVSVRFIDTRADTVLLVPTEALIETGRRSLVMLADADGHFTPVEVEAGIESGGQTEIKRGLKAGQRVVVSSQFLIDSEASLKGVEARLNDSAATPGARP